MNSESDVAADTYRFRLSRFLGNAISQDSSIIGNPVSSSRHESTAPTEQSGTARLPGTAQKIFHSRYTGDGVAGGLHSAEIVTRVSSLPEGEGRPLPIFRWM